jgi:hypothetical protein
MLKGFMVPRSAWAENFGLFMMMKAVLDGRAHELIDLARVNLERGPADYTQRTGFWGVTRSPRWVRTLSRPVAATCITEYIWAIARLFTIRD